MRKFCWLGVVLSLNATAAGDNNYPWKTRQQCTYDLALPDDTGDDTYMQVEGGLSQVHFLAETPSCCHAAAAC